MKTELNTAAMCYQANAAQKMKQEDNSKKVLKAENEQTAQVKQTDTLEFSKEGLEALEKQQNSENTKQSYDLSKVMKLHEKGFHQMLTKEESDYYWSARKSDPKLDISLYEQDKAEALKVVGKVQIILMKAASGEKLTPEEEKMVKEDQALAQEVEKRKSQMSFINRK